MKRAALILFVAAAAGATGIYLWQQHAGGGGSVSAVTALLPGETVALVHLPDCNRIRDDWQNTELYQLYREPTVQEFLRHPDTRAAANTPWGTDLSEFQQLHPRDVFVALIPQPGTAASASGVHPGFVCGFRFSGDQAAAEGPVAKLRKQLLGQSAATPVSSENYGAHKIDYYAGRNLKVATSYSGQWFFAADQTDQLKAVLDRADGTASAKPASPSPATPPSPLLRDSEPFRSAVAEMPSQYAFLLYLDPKTIRQFVATWRPNESALLDQVEAICATSGFDKGKIHDVLFVAMPKREGNAALTRKSAALGSKDTFLYTTSLLNVSPGLRVLDPTVAGGMFAGLVNKISSAVARAHITMADWEAAFGGEASLLAEWPPDAHWPSLVAAFPVREFEQAKSLAGVVARASDEDADWREFDRNGVHYLSAQAPANLFVLRPTIAVSQQVMVAGLDPGAVDVAMQRSIKSSGGLADSAAYKPAASSVGVPTSFFAYVDLALLYGRLDVTLRPFLGMGAAILPGLNNHVDFAHMPPVEVVAKHLSPIVSSQRYNGRGYVTESMGPITLSQSGVALILLAAAGYHTPLQQFTVPQPSPTPTDTP